MFLIQVRACTVIGCAVVLLGCAERGKVEWSGDAPSNSPSADQQGSTIEEIAEAYLDGSRRNIPVHFEPEVRILSPREGEVITAEVYDRLRGSVNSLPQDKQLWIFLRDRYSWFLQYPPPAVDARHGSFDHKNVRMATAGIWEIHVSQADQQASRYLHCCADRGQWHFPTLPAGVESMASVKVQRVTNDSKFDGH